MKTDTIDNLSRRAFLRAGLAAGTGLVLGVYLPRVRAATAGVARSGTEAIGPETFAPNAFVRIDPDDTVTVVIKHLEMGQGTYTGLSTLVAEELDAAWEQIRPVAAPANAALYNNLLWGDVQGTGGSTAIANAFTQMRKAGAVAREMLVAAAAQQWGVPAAAIEVSRGVVIHPGTGRRASFGELATAAAKQPVPQEVFLKDPEAFRLIGSKLPRKDTDAKINGQALFTQDVRLEGMLIAVVAHPPRFGAKLKSFDDTQARKVKGVARVVQIPNAVAVLATNTWAAMQGRDALEVEWDESGAMQLGTAELMAQYRQLAETPGTVARRMGSVAAALEKAAKTVAADYQVPYLAHATMEPLNCVVRVSAAGCEIWNGEQFQTPDQRAVADLLKIEPGQVKIHMLYAGGSFGRRANPHADYVLEAVAIAKASARDVPIKLVWTREDDMRAGYYRPMYLHRLHGAVDAEGNLIAWKHRIVGQSIMTGTMNEGSMVKDGVDESSVEGVVDTAYTIPNVLVELHSPRVPVPVQWWRSVGHSHTAFVVEGFIDELAAAAGQDPVAFRRALLVDAPRWRAALDLAADMAHWGEPVGEGRGRGVAVHEAFNTCVAQVADVTVHEDNSFTVDRVVIAVDCGIAVNPDIVIAQMEGGMGFGLSAALMNEITLTNGRVDQSNFDTYPVLRLDQMPQVEVHIVPSDRAPTGVGEPAVPVIAPAVANALAAATGRRLRALPLRLKG